ncbi:hypothetical protein B9D02_23490 (plasmid) [Pantoea vagans]|nr:hypothetical protein [Pantoea vagans]AWP35517.1 hypothetical protein B9D02_23490 [Pantoea vagans]
MSKVEDDGKRLFTETASADDIRAAAMKNILSNYVHVDDTGMARELFAAAEASFTEGDFQAYRGLRLLGTVCMFHMRSDDPADTWHPRWTDGDIRDLTPADVRGEQNTALSECIVEITHPALRARVADVVWSNDRKEYKAANEAIKAYCECADGLIGGVLEEKDKGHQLSLFEISNLIQRALFIHFSSAKKKTIPTHLRHSFISLYNYSLSNYQYVVFARLGELAVGYKIFSFKEVANDSEKLVSLGSANDYPEARKRVWALAARCYEYIDDKESRRRCLGRSVDETLKMCDQVSGYAAKATWMRQAINELRIAGGFQDRVQKLIEDMRIAQLASLDELSEYKMPLDLTEKRKSSTDKFSKLTLPEVMFHFAIITESPPVDMLKQIAYDERPTGLASLIFSKSKYLDREGKVIGVTTGKIGSDGPDKNWYKENSLNVMNETRHNIVAGIISPARHAVMHNYPIETRHFDPIVSLSPFVPFGHEHIFSLGFARFWQGDFASAAFLLIPQLENSLRWILINAGRDSSKTEKGETQEDRSLSGLIENKIEDLYAILGDAIVNEIDMLFHFKLGPSLRHKIAHGKLTAGDCYSVECIYACWFIYHLTCLPLLQDWTTQVAPQIILAL